MGEVFHRFPRMLRDLAARLGKQLELRTVGEATELDKGMIEKITDPLTHLVRNAVDHGLELPAERLAAGKPPHGTLTLAARHEGGCILIEVQDDGRGLDRARILAKARRSGIPIADDAPDAEVWQLIFAPGFSTAEAVTDVSGRGVGMDVVRRNILALGGSVELDSAAGRGTTVRVRLPLTLAIMDGISVGVAGELYLLPLASVIESFQAQPGAIRTMPPGRRVVRVRDEYLPVVSLGAAMGATDTAGNATPMLVLVQAEGQRIALEVGELVGQQQVVVKNLEANYRRVPGVSGATIMGDGTVALIVDVAALARGTPVVPSSSVPAGRQAGMSPACAAASDSALTH
jgi:two-component system chemotaxis sensor kinase CheA